MEGRPGAALRAGSGGLAGVFLVDDAVAVFVEAGTNLASGLQRYDESIALREEAVELLSRNGWTQDATVGHEVAAILKARGRPLVDANCLAQAARAHLLGERAERVLEPAERALELIGGLRARVEMELVATLGEALARLGHRERAESCLRRALELSEVHEDAAEGERVWGALSRLRG